MPITEVRTELSKELVLTNSTMTFTIKEPSGIEHVYRVQFKPKSVQYPEAWFVHYQNGPTTFAYLGKLDDFTFQCEPTQATGELSDSHKLKLLNRVLARIAADDHEAYQRHGYEVFTVVPVEMTEAQAKVARNLQGMIDRTNQLIKERRSTVADVNQVKELDEVQRCEMPESIYATDLTGECFKAGTDIRSKSMRVYSKAKNREPLDPKQFLFADAVYALAESRLSTGGDEIVDSMTPLGICRTFRSLDDAEKFMNRRAEMLADMEVTHV